MVHRVGGTVTLLAVINLDRLGKVAKGPGWHRLGLALSRPGLKRHGAEKCDSPAGPQRLARARFWLANRCSAYDARVHGC